MESNTLILGQNQYYSLDGHQTKLNNNVLVVGPSGAGKTRSIVTPNLLQATGSYVVSDRSLDGLANIFFTQAPINANNFELDEFLMAKKSHQKIQRKIQKKLSKKTVTTILDALYNAILCNSRWKSVSDYVIIKK